MNMAALASIHQVPSTAIVLEDSQDLDARLISTNVIRIPAKTRGLVSMNEVDFAVFACLVSFSFSVFNYFLQEISKG